jgi:hypothetical protein
MTRTMEIVDQVKSMLGIGAPTITIEGVEGTARAGEVIRGVVVLVGGDHDVAVQDLELRLDELRLTHTSPTAADPPERHPVRRLVGVKLGLDGCALRSGERLERAFELRLPPDLEPSAGPRCYALVAEAEMPGINSSAALPLIVAA